MLHQPLQQQQGRSTPNRPHADAEAEASDTTAAESGEEGADTETAEEGAGSDAGEEGSAEAESEPEEEQPAAEEEAALEEGSKTSAAVTKKSASKASSKKAALADAAAEESSAEVESESEGSDAAAEEEVKPKKKSSKSLDAEEKPSKKAPGKSSKASKDDSISSKSSKGCDPIVLLDHGNTLAIDPAVVPALLSMPRHSRCCHNRSYTSLMSTDPATASVVYHLPSSTLRTTAFAPWWLPAAAAAEFSTSAGLAHQSLRLC